MDERNIHGKNRTKVTFKSEALGGIAIETQLITYALRGSPNNFTHQNTFSNVSIRTKHKIKTINILNNLYIRE